MKLSTARKVVFTKLLQGDVSQVLATAVRVCIQGNRRRYGFPDGSVVESINDRSWSVVK